jgi:hypothetical protein
MTRPIGILLFVLTTILSTNALGQPKAMETISLKQRAALTCKLTSKELQERRRTVLADLKRQMIKKNELENGFEYIFAGTDQIIDQLTTFIKTERQCCDFFDYDINISGDVKGQARLKISGPAGVKDFIEEELGL